MTLALWIPGAGAQDGRQMYQGMRHDWHDMRQDRQDMQRDRNQIWQDRRAGNYGALAHDREAFWRERAQLRANHWNRWHNWHHIYRYHYNRW